MNPWNTQMPIDFDPEMKKRILEYYNTIINYGSNKRTKARKTIKLDDEALLYLTNKYVIEQYGYKVLGRALDLTYSRTRSLLKDYLHINVRNGYRVVTDRLRKFRSDRVKGNLNPWSQIIPHKINNQRSIQGVYTKKDGTEIWLRSSWEYIYAKWLEKQNIQFSVEVKSFELSNKQRYTPDFFIYDSNGMLDHIVEIKGYRSRLYKTELFKNEYPEYKLIVITNISDYYENYKLEVQEWRNICQSKQLN